MAAAKRKYTRKFAQFEEQIREQRRRLRQRLATANGEDMQEQAPDDEGAAALQALERRASRAPRKAVLLA